MIDVPGPIYPLACIRPIHYLLAIVAGYPLILFEVFLGYELGLEMACKENRDV